MVYTHYKEINMSNYVTEFANTKVTKRFYFGELTQINVLMTIIYRF